MCATSVSLRTIQWDEHTTTFDHSFSTLDVTTKGFVATIMNAKTIPLYEGFSSEREKTEAAEWKKTECSKDPWTQHFGSQDWLCDGMGLNPSVVYRGEDKRLMHNHGRLPQSKPWYHRVWISGNHRSKSPH